MPWPFPDFLRPFMRMASYWLGTGRAPDWILNWAREEYSPADAAVFPTAIPEAARANYFAARLREADPNVTMSRLWGYYARGAWYAGYGRAPTADERSWAYTRPSQMIGLMFEVRGRTVHSGQEVRYTLSANVPWNSTLWDAMLAAREWISDVANVTGEMGSDALDYDTVTVALIGGALIERQVPTIPAEFFGGRP